MMVSRRDLKRPKPATGDSRTWAEQARAAIEAVHLTLDRGCSIEERTAAIDAAFPFGRRAHYPYEVWCRERRSYLDRFAPAGRKPSTKGTRT
nr:hypothetical protein [Cereibacter changlensis]